MNRPVTATLFVSLDLVAEAPDTWHFPWVGPRLLAEVDRDQSTATTLLLGRRTYEVFASSWPGRGDDVALASNLNAMEKVVISSTLTDPTWSNTRVLRPVEGLGAAVKDLVQQGEGRITVAGSLDLVEGLVVEGLLEELRLIVHPVVLGAGRRLFERSPGGRVDLELLETVALDVGVQLHVHRPVR